MSAAHTSITGYSIVPAGERVARPTRRRVGGSWWHRTVARRQARRSHQQAWNARRAAEAAASPTVTDPRDSFTRRHPGADLHRL